MFLRMQDFDFCLNLNKFNPIYPNFAQIGLNFAEICLKNLLGYAAATPASIRHCIEILSY